MSKYIRNYDSRSAYEVDTARPKDKSVVSKTGNDVRYDPVNVIIPYRSSFLHYGDMPIYDRIDKERKILKMQTVDSIANIDSTRYVFSNSFYVCSEMGKDYFKWYQSQSLPFANPVEYKLTLDLTANGGFNYSYTQNGSAVTGSVTWSAGDSIESVIAAINKNTFTKVDANNVKVSWTSNNGDTLTISNDTGVTLLDCTLSARIGVNGTPFNVHKGFQTNRVDLLFPTLDYVCPNNTAGMGMKKICSLTQGVNYYKNSGSSTFQTYSEGIMNLSTFNSCNGSGIEEQQRLYDENNGNYTEYMINFIYDGRGVSDAVAITYGMAERFTKSLASVFFTGADGSVKNVYPIASYAQNVGVTAVGETTGFEPGNFFCCSINTLIQSHIDEITDALSSSAAKIQGSSGSWNSSELCVAESSGITKWVFLSSYGGLANGTTKFSSHQCRPVLVLPSV